MLRLSNDKKRYEFEQSSCHSRLNNFGRMALSNSQRYNSLNCHSGTLKNVHTSRLVDSIINQHRDRKSSRPLKMHMPKFATETSMSSNMDLNPEKEMATRKLNKQVELIRNMRLLGGISLKQVKYEGHIKIPTVHNDYHSSSSNAGYSRKPDGGIYPK